MDENMLQSLNVGNGYIIQDTSRLGLKSRFRR